MDPKGKEIFIELEDHQENELNSLTYTFAQFGKENQIQIHKEKNDAVLVEKEPKSDEIVMETAKLNQLNLYGLNSTQNNERKSDAEDFNTFSNNLNSKRPLKLVSTKTQTQFGDEDLLHPIDYRKCLKCGKNDVISPNGCFYKIRKFASNRDVNSSLRVKAETISAKNHIYSYNDDEKNRQDENEMVWIHPSKSNFNLDEMKDMSCQTIIHISDLEILKRKNGKKELKDFFYIDKELISPRNI